MSIEVCVLQGHLKKAASVLKKARSKSKLPEGKVGMKRKLDATLADETSNVNSTFQNRKIYINIISY